jgi:hypothetical protein
VQSHDESSDDSLDNSEKAVNKNMEDSHDATGHEVLFYPEEIEIEKSSADSAQSVVYFGREATL